MVRITVSMRFPGTDPYAHSETRVFEGDERDFAKWLDVQTGPGGKWVKWSRQSTVTYRHR